MKRNAGEQMMAVFDRTLKRLMRLDKMNKKLTEDNARLLEIIRGLKKEIKYLERQML